MPFLSTVCRNKNEFDLYNLLSDPIRKLGFDIIRVRIVAKRQVYKMQLLLEIANVGKADGHLGKYFGLEKDQKNITIGDCQKVSKYAKNIMSNVDEYGDIDYFLEVSSPGIDRPLTKKEDFEKFMGYVIKVTTFRKINGKNRFRCRLIKVLDESIECIEEENMAMQVKPEEKSVPSHKNHKSRKNGDMKNSAILDKKDVGDLKKDPNKDLSNQLVEENSNDMRSSRGSERSIIFPSSNIAEAKLCLDWMLEQNIV